MEIRDLIAACGFAIAAWALKTTIEQGKEIVALKTKIEEGTRRFEEIMHRFDSLETKLDDLINKNFMKRRTSDE
jgi:hypothetical protein